jgi:hypothetical protein
MTAKKTGEIVETVTSIVTGYVNLKTSTGDLNRLGVEFAVNCGNLILNGKATGRAFRASIKSAGIVKAVAVKESHAEALYLVPTMVTQLGGIAKIENVSELLSVAVRIYRNGGEIPAGATMDEVTADLPTIKEISDAKKAAAESESESVEIEIPTLDALVLGFVAELKKLSKGEKLNALKFTDISTPALEEMKVILGTIAKNTNKK